MISLSSLLRCCSSLYQRSFVGVVETSLNFVVDDLLGLRKSGLQFAGKGVEASAADSLLFATSLGVLLLKSSLTCYGSCCGSLNFESASSVGVGVESLHKGSVFKGVLVGGLGSKRGGSDGTELALHLVRVDNSGEISDCHQTSVELIATLLDALFSVSSKNFVEMGEGILSEDYESADVTTWRELKQVKSVDAASIDSREISGGSLKEGVLVSIYKEGTLSQRKARVSHLVLTSSGGSALADSLEVT